MGLHNYKIYYVILALVFIILRLFLKIVNLMLIVQLLKIVNHYRAYNILSLYI